MVLDHLVDRPADVAVLLLQLLLGADAAGGSGPMPWIAR
jgi:hypothetical protein